MEERAFFPCYPWYLYLRALVFAHESISFPLTEFNKKAVTWSHGHSCDHVTAEGFNQKGFLNNILTINNLHTNKYCCRREKVTWSQL